MSFYGYGVDFHSKISFRIFVHYIQEIKKEEKRCNKTDKSNKHKGLFKMFYELLRCFFSNLKMVRFIRYIVKTFLTVE